MEKTVFTTDLIDTKRIIRNIMNTLLPFRRNEEIPRKTHMATTDPREK